MYFGCSKELSLYDDSFEYSLYMFWFRNKQIDLELPALNCSIVDGLTLIKY